MKELKAALDLWIGKFISRKLLVFLVCTVALFWEKVSGSEWINVAVVYIGSQAVIDAIVKLRK